MMLAGTALVALAAVATAALTGALWFWLYARGCMGGGARLGGALSFAGAIPYVAFALVVRALVCRRWPSSPRAVGSRCVRMSNSPTVRSLGSAGPARRRARLGLGISRGLWSWLDDVRAARRAATRSWPRPCAGSGPGLLVRQGLWLRRRRELGALLLAGMAAAVLIDILSNTLIDSFRPPGFPPYPSLGAALFLREPARTACRRSCRGRGEGPTSRWSRPRSCSCSRRRCRGGRGRSRSKEGSCAWDATCSRGASPAPTASRRVPRCSGSWALPDRARARCSAPGRPSSRAPSWSRRIPTRRCPRAFSSTDVARVARSGHARADRVLWTCSEGSATVPSGAACSIPSLGRRPLPGERQRLLLSLAFSRARADPGCTLFPGRAHLGAGRPAHARALGLLARAPAGAIHGHRRGRPHLPRSRADRGAPGRPRRPGDRGPRLLDRRRKGARALGARRS